MAMGAFHDSSLGVPVMKSLGADNMGGGDPGDVRLLGGRPAKKRRGGQGGQGGQGQDLPWWLRGRGGSPGVNPYGYVGSGAGGLIVGNQMRRALGMPEWDYSGDKQQDLVQNTLADRMNVLHNRYGPSSINPNVMRDVEPKSPMPAPVHPLALSRPSFTSGIGRNTQQPMPPGPPPQPPDRRFGWGGMDLSGMGGGFY